MTPGRPGCGSTRARRNWKSAQRPVVEAEAGVDVQRAELQTLQNLLLEDRRRFDEEARCQRERWEAQCRRAAAEIDQQHRLLGQQSEQVDQSRSALEQLRGELGRMHRETLEIRLATEELWAELSGDAPPAALTRSLGHIRTKLADHYRLANAELHQRKEELERLRDQLARQYEKLVEQKRQFDGWSAGCREEAESQSERLSARGARSRSPRGGVAGAPAAMAA